MSICCQKSLPETCKLRALELQPKLGKEWERYWNVFVPKQISIYKRVEGSWGVRGEWKRCRKEIDLSKSKMLSVCISCGVFPGLGEKRWKLEHSLIPSYKKNQANSAQFHNIHSITPLIIHMCSKNKNTNDQMSFLSGGCYTCEETLVGGLQLHRCSCVCVKSRLSEREQKKLWISLTLGFMGPWPPLFHYLCI